MTIIMRVIKSSGIENINLDVDIFTNIFNLFKTEDKSAKKNKSKDKRKIVLDAAMVVFSQERIS